MNETIEAFLKNLFYCLSWKHTLGLNYFTLFFVFPSYFRFFKFGKKFRDFWKSFFFAKITFANFSSNFLLGINFRENGAKSRKSRKFLPAKFSALKVCFTQHKQHPPRHNCYLRNGIDFYWYLIMNRKSRTRHVILVLYFVVDVKQWLADLRCWWAKCHG